MWKCGDSQAFSKALLEVAAQPRAAARAAARAHFDRELSFAAGGYKLSDAYRDVLEQRVNAPALELA